MGWKDIPKPKPVPAGEWEKTGIISFLAWHLRCPPCFYALITARSGEFWLQINDEGFGARRTLEMAQIEAETRIVAQIKATLPVYKTIVERLEARSLSNIIVMKPKDTP